MMAILGGIFGGNSQNNIPKILETSLYRFNTSSDSQMVIFLKTDRDAEAIAGIISTIASENPSQYNHQIKEARCLCQIAGVAILV